MDQQLVDPSLPTAVIAISSLHLMTRVHIQLGLFAQLLQSPNSIIERPIGYQVSPFA